MSDFKVKMYQIQFLVGLRFSPRVELSAIPTDSLAVFKGLTSNGREGKGRGRRGEGRERGRRIEVREREEGKGRKRGACEKCEAYRAYKLQLVHP